KVRDAADLCAGRVGDPAAVRRRYAGGDLRFRGDLRHRTGWRIHGHSAHGRRAVRRARPGARDGRRPDRRRRRRSGRPGARRPHARRNGELRHRLPGGHRVRAGGRGRDFVPAAGPGAYLRRRRGAACCAPTGGLMATRRVGHVGRAIVAGKHVYCEKPVAASTMEALELARSATRRGVKHGVVQDKLFLPGIRKLKRLVDDGFFGRLLSVRGEFGYWVFEGDGEGGPAQRPSWNYRKEDGGGIVLDMFAHWRYLLDHTFGPVTAVQCTGATHIPERRDEQGRRYAATADDAAYATFALDRPTG